MRMFTKCSYYICFFSDFHHICVIRFGFSKILSVNFVCAPLYIACRDRDNRFSEIDNPRLETQIIATDRRRILWRLQLLLLLLLLLMLLLLLVVAADAAAAAAAAAGAAAAAAAAAVAGAATCCSRRVAASLVL
jgi:hypothetical protein